MFSLVSYNYGEFCVVDTKKTKPFDGDGYIFKYKGGSYLGTIIAKSGKLM